MSVTPTTIPRYCVVAACMREAKGNFCLPCFKKLPGDMRNAIVQSAKSNYKKKEMVAQAKAFLDDLNTKESSNAATRAGD